MNKVGLIGIIVVIVATVFGMAETIYFGSNWAPSSDAELVCDVIAASLVGIGLILISIPAFVRIGKLW